MGAHLAIDPSECIGCGLCVRVCIRENIGIVDGTATELDSGLCFDCGHCYAVCPRGAITMRDARLVPPPVVSVRTDGDGLMGLLASRRSSRWFTGERIPDDVLDRLFEAASLSPTAQNAMDVEFVVVEEGLEGFQALLADILEPISGGFPRIAQFVDYVRSGDRSGPNPFLWDGRQVILSFSSEPVNAVIAMTRVELMAQAMGLGGFYSLWMSKADRQDHGRFMSFFPDVDPAKRLGAVFVIGVPRVGFRRPAPRPAPVVHRM